MASTSTATFTTVELGQSSALHSSSTSIELGRVNASASRKSFTGSSDETEILRASAIADSDVPDGGSGWLVIFGCAVVAWWFIGTNYSWGVFQAALVQDQLSTPSTLAFVGSLTVTFIAVLAVVNASIIRKLGARKAALLGILFFGSGQILSGFSVRHIGGLFASSGIVTGIGTSLCFMVISVVPAQWFSRRRGLANGIVYAGGGLGGTAICFIADALIRKVGIAWAFRTLGLLTLGTGLPAAWMIKERSPIHSPSFIEWRLFRDFKFVFLFVSGALATFPLFVPPFFLPLYSHSLGLSSSAGAGLVAGFNFSSAVGRLGCGLISDKFGPLNTLVISLLVSALSMLALWPVSNTLAPLIAFVIINGAANGGFFSTIPTVVSTVFGSARISVAMGMIVTGWAGGYLMGAPIAGYLLDAYGGENSSLKAYHPAMFYAGGMALAATGFVVLVRFKYSMKVFKKL